MHQADFHPVSTTNTYVKVVLPLATPKVYTYEVPEALIPMVGFGKRVEVQFGRNKLYAGVVVEVSGTAPQGYRPKPILAVIDQFVFSRGFSGRIGFLPMTKIFYLAPYPSRFCFKYYRNNPIWLHFLFWKQLSFAYI